MYMNAVSKMKVSDVYSKEFSVQLGVHQGFIFNRILFVIVLLAITEGFKTGCPWEHLYGDDFVLIAESRPKLEKKFQV